MAQPVLAPLAALDHVADEPEDTGDASARRVATKFREFLEALGLDMEDPNLSGTEGRVARAYRERKAGSTTTTSAIRGVFEDERSRQKLLALLPPRRWASGAARPPAEED